METSTRNVMNPRLQEWRRALEARGLWSRAQLDELEGHIEDGAASLQSKGLTEDEALLISMRRLGSGAALTEEYGRSGVRSAWGIRVYWMAVGVLGVQLWRAVATLVASGVLWFGSAFSLEGVLLGWVATGIELALGAGLVWAFVGIAARGGMAVFLRSHERPWAWVGGLLACQGLVFLAAQWMRLNAIAAVPPGTLGGFFLVEAMASMASFVLIPVVALATVAPGRLRLAGSWVWLLTLTAGVLGGCGDRPAGTSSASGPVAVAGEGRTVLEDSLDVWRSGNKAAAVDTFLKLDPSARLFAPGAPLSLSESAFVALPAEAREKMQAKMLDDLKAVKELAVAVMAAAATAEGAGDPAKAARYRAQLRSLAGRLEEPKYSKLVQVVGAGLRKHAELAER